MSLRPLAPESATLWGVADHTNVLEYKSAMPSGRSMVPVAFLFLGVQVLWWYPGVFLSMYLEDMSRPVGLLLHLSMAMIVVVSALCAVAVAGWAVCRGRSRPEVLVAVAVLVLAGAFLSYVMAASVNEYFHPGPSL